MAKFNYPKFTPEELAEYATSIYPDRNIEALKTTLRNEVNGLREAVGELIRRIEQCEEALNNGDISSERIVPTQGLVTEARGAIDELQFITSYDDGLEENRKSVIELREAINSYYHEFIRPQMNLNNSKKNEGGDFCYQLQNDDLKGLSPITLDPKILRALVRIRDSKSAKAIEVYKQEKVWSEVVWVQIDGRIFALNVAKDSGGRVVNMTTIEASLPRQTI